MKQYFVVERTPGASWQQDVPMNGQAQWAEHATFMNSLAAEGKVVLGGPIGAGGDILLIVKVASEAQAKATFDDDPWTAMGLLEISRLRDWTILLDASGP